LIINNYNFVFSVFIAYLYAHACVEKRTLEQFLGISRKQEELQGPRDLTHCREGIGDKSVYHLIHKLVGNWRREDLCARPILIPIPNLVLEYFGVWELGAL
jgi:hypothetical protein